MATRRALYHTRRCVRLLRLHGPRLPASSHIAVAAPFSSSSTNLLRASTVAPASAAAAARAAPVHPIPALAAVVEGATARFDETIDVAIKLGVDPRRADQNVRGSVELPHGTPKGATVAVLAEDGSEALADAEAAGADLIGGEDTVAGIVSGDIPVSHLTTVISTPTFMRVLGKAGRILGPKGLMPNAKTGTLVDPDDVGGAVERARRGAVTFKVDRGGMIHCGFGKASWPADQLEANLRALLVGIGEAKPPTLEVTKRKPYVVQAHVSSTMGGAGVPLDQETLDVKSKLFFCSEEEFEEAVAARA